MEHLVWDSVDLSSHGFLLQTNILSFIPSFIHSVSQSFISASYVYDSVLGTVDSAIHDYIYYSVGKSHFLLLLLFKLWTLLRVYLQSFLSYSKMYSKKKLFRELILSIEQLLKIEENQ